MVLFWRSYFKTNPVENRIENRILKQVQYKQHLFIHLQGGQIIGRNAENSPKRRKSHLVNTKPKLDQVMDQRIFGTVNQILETKSKTNFNPER